MLRPPALVALLLLVVPPAIARAHVPPGVYHLVAADEERLVWTVVARPEWVRHWLGAASADATALGEAERAAAGPALLAALSGRLQVRVDRVDVAPVLQGLTPLRFEDHARTYAYERIALAFGLKGRPREIELAWTGYDAPPGLSADEVDLELEAFGTTEYLTLRAREPGTTFHVPRVARRDAPYEAPRARPVTPRELPAVSLGALAVLVLATGTFLRGRLAPRPFAVTALACGLAAVALWGSFRVAWPFVGPRAYERPGAEEAGRVFESLHRNIYRAFDYASEDAIYATLAQSVRGDLLDAVYAEVYESLIQRDQAGAVSRVLKTEILDRSVRFPEDEEDPSFSVRCRWRVHGQVGHFGHTHQRVNEFEADYGVTRVADRWAIASAAILDRRRVDDGTQR